MAYLTRLCERWLPACCPLCAQAGRAGGLCPRCAACLAHSHAAVPWRCVRCGLAAMPPGACPQCAECPPQFERAFVGFDYQPPFDLLIHRLKVQKQLHVVPLMGRLLAARIQAQWHGRPQDVLLLPVPAHHSALLRRGFNPAAELARDLAARLRLRCRTDALRRAREGPRQASLGRQARHAAAAGLYRVCADVTGRDVAVVDDVMTTASTMNAVAAQLRAAGARSVHALVVARTPQRAAAD